MDIKRNRCTSTSDIFQSAHAAFKNKDKKLPEDMLTEEEIIKMINAAPNTRDKAMIGLLWDIGSRIGEVGALKIKHIKFNEYGAVILINGKTEHEG